MEGRDRKKYQHKGLCQTTVKTVYGEVTYQRAVYEATEEDGFKHYVYLLEILMSAKAPKKDGKGHEFPVIGHMVRLEGTICGDRTKLLVMVGF